MEVTGFEPITRIERQTLILGLPRVQSGGRRLAAQAAVRSLIAKTRNTWIQPEARVILHSIDRRHSFKFDSPECALTPRSVGAWQVHQADYNIFNDIRSLRGGHACGMRSRGGLARAPLGVVPYVLLCGLWMLSKGKDVI